MSYKIFFTITLSIIILSGNNNLKAEGETSRADNMRKRVAQGSIDHHEEKPTKADKLRKEIADTKTTVIKKNITAKAKPKTLQSMPVQEFKLKKTLTDKEVLQRIENEINVVKKILSNLEQSVEEIKQATSNH